MALPTRLLPLAFGLLFAGASPALAWKPKTHVYLAEQALKDAIDDGTVTIFEVDHETGKVKRGPDGPIKIGTYKVDPRILDALKKHPDQFRAGVLGPDAFPDLLTGQQIIHPAGRVTPGETGAGINRKGVGPDPWMQHLWDVAFAQKGADATPATRAFVVGFLAHAAGDMFAHTCVNHYTGDNFNFDRNPQNAIRHIVVEGCFDKHFPAPTYKSSIGDGVDGFIYRHMIQGRPGTPVARLLVGESVKTTLAARFSNLRNQLDADVKAAKVPTPVSLYEEAWIKDIDRGLEKLPAMSHELAKALMFNDTGKADTKRAKEILDKYATDHLLSMAGAPDAAVKTFELLRAVAKFLQLPWVEQFIADVKKDALNYVVRTFTGMSVADLEEALLAEAKIFDRVMDAPPLENGHRTTLKDFEKNELRVAPGGWINYDHVPPAYNTVTMIKLSLLGREEVNRLMADLGSREKLAEENAMLGYVETLDGNNQWSVNPKKMIVARHPAGYKRVFMRQNGQDRPANPRLVDGASNIDYQIAVKTADKLLAGTDSGVFITVVGTKGKTPEMKLNGLIRGNAFERNQTDKCVLENLPDVGDLVSVTVRSDGAGAAPDWFLDFVVVTPDRRPPVKFPCGRELKKGNLSVTLAPGK